MFGRVIVSFILLNSIVKIYTHCQINKVKSWLFHCSMDVGSNRVIIDLTEDEAHQME